jgi:hypothetical protein
MKKNQEIIVALAVVCILSIVLAVIFLSSDREAPVITVDSSKVKPYSAEQDTDVLKAYAKAVDNKDGDVSSSILIENVYVMTDLEHAKVVYVARDSSGNIARYNYMIDYNASEEEIAKQKAMLEEETTADAEGTSKSKETTKDSETTKETTKASSKTEAETAKGAPTLVMTDSEATVKKGSSFNISNYIDKITDDVDSSNTLSRRIVVNGTYSTSLIGTYTLDVYCTDTDSNESNHVEFTLHVE